MNAWLERCFSRRPWIYGFLILIAYGGSLLVPFYFDDQHSIADNSALSDLGNLLRHWVDPRLTSVFPPNQSYRPLTFMVYNALKVWGGGETWPFHLHKLLLLWGIVLLVERIWNRLIPDSRFFGFALACLWCVHPALSEATVYITASSSLQAAFFYFLAFWLFVRKPGAGIGVALTYAASCFSKEEGITLPAMLWIWSMWQGDARTRRKELIGVSLIGVAIFIWIQHQIPATQSVSRGTVPPLEYLWTQIRAWLHYERLWIWPAGLNADFTAFGFSKSFFDPLVFGCFAIQASITAILYRFRREVPAAWFGWLWYYVTISPASSVIPLSDAVNERRMIIAYLGYTGALAVVVKRAAERLMPTIAKTAVPSTVAGLLVVGTWITRERVEVWEDPIRLRLDIVDKNPGSKRAIHQLAAAELKAELYPEALRHFEECLRPPVDDLLQYYYCHTGRGNALLAMDRDEEARVEFEKVVKEAPILALGHYSFAFYWYRKHDLNRALALLNEAIRVSEGAHGPALQFRAQILEELKTAR